MLDYTYVRPYTWSNPTWPGGGFIRGGERIFSEDEIKLIKIWRDRDGWAGLTLEEFFEAINEQ